MDTFSAGTARINVTPEPLLPVSHGLDSCRIPTEKLGELEVRVVVLAKGDTRVALVSMPFIAWSTYLCDRIRDQVADIPRDNVVISVTHAHASPDPYGFPFRRRHLWYRF